MWSFGRSDDHFNNYYYLIINLLYISLILRRLYDTSFSVIRVYHLQKLELKINSAIPRLTIILWDSLKERAWVANIILHRGLNLFLCFRFLQVPGCQMLVYVANYLTYEQYSFYEVLQSIVIKTFSQHYFFEAYFTMIRLRLKKLFHLKKDII